MKKFSKMGKLLAFIGIWVFAFGVAFSIIDAPEPYSSLSIPLMILGVVMLISSNFFRNNKAQNG